MLDVTEAPQDLDATLTLAPDADGLVAAIPPSLSNAPQSMAPEKGGPFGGLMAALAVGAARQALGISAPLQTLSVQYLAAARFDQVRFTAETLRGGRSTHFAQVRGGQPGRPAIAASATFGTEGPGPAVRPLAAMSPARPLGEIESTDLDPRFAPWFTRWVEYRFAEPFLGFGNHDEPVVRVWLRLKDGKPLDEARLCFLLDALFPNYFLVTGLTSVSTTVDLRYDLFEPQTPEMSPEGWAYFEFRSHDVSGGWAVEDGVALSPAGTPIAAARQLRKMVARPS